MRASDFYTSNQDYIAGYPRRFQCNVAERCLFLMPNCFRAAEIKALVDNLGIRERMLVLLAVSTGLRQSELFALKWGDGFVPARLEREFK